MKPARTLKTVIAAISVITGTGTIDRAAMRPAVMTVARAISHVAASSNQTDWQVDY